MFFAINLIFFSFNTNLKKNTANEKRVVNEGEYLGGLQKHTDLTRNATAVVFVERIKKNAVADINLYLYSHQKLFGLKFLFICLLFT